MIFYKSIILIVDETEDGLTGFILNRHSDLFITKDIRSAKKVKIDVYYGGPVSHNHYYLLKTNLFFYFFVYQSSVVLRPIG